MKRFRRLALAASPTLAAVALLVWYSDAQFARPRVEIVAPSGESCRVDGRLPMSYAS